MNPYERAEAAAATNRSPEAGPAAHRDVHFHAETEPLPWRAAEWSAVMLGLCWLFACSWSFGSSGAAARRGTHGRGKRE